jgi:CubicO group peptidase (beta-lactamase class C family)
MTEHSHAVHGCIASGFDSVAAEFQRQLDESPDAGAAFAAVVDDHPIIDLWGGTADADSGTPWGEDTLQLIFSGTKGLIAVCLLLLVDRGAIDLDAPMSRYWPGLAAADKGHTLVRHVVSHQAGLPGLRRPFAASDLLDGGRMIELVAQEEPFWEPGARLAYHALTFGWLCDGLIRHVDGRSAGRLFADEVAAPLGLELWIGLPSELQGRVARLHRAADYRLTFCGEEPEPLLETVYGSLVAGEFPWNDPEFQQVEIPAMNAIGTARSIARLYGCLARGGEIDGVRLLSEQAVRLGRTELSRGICAITRRPYAFGIGFELQTELAALGPAAAAFGHTGAGGSSHGSWLDERVGFSYATNALCSEGRDDRARRLLVTLYGSLHAGRATGSVADG